jgi:general secretion pathway protein D
MRTTIRMRLFVSLLVTFCLLVMPISTFAKKGDAHFKKGMEYEAAQQWEKAAQEFTLAVAANPANTEYQLHFRRATFNASQAFMSQGRALAERRDYVGAYNAFRQAYGYDPVNQLAVSEMERMLRLQAVKDGTAAPNATTEGEENGGGTPSTSQPAQEPAASQGRVEQLRVISYNGDLKAFIRSLCDQLNLNVVFDKVTFMQPRTIDINLKEVTTAQALDYIFLQESLFFQKLSKRTILVADQQRRAQYQQLVLRTFFLSNTDPQKASELITRAIPPSVGRPQTIVVPDKDTNTLTVRDTAENVRLIGDLLTSIDKDRPEVVMDVNIYEVSKSDLLQLGNQIGTAPSGGTFSLGGSPGLTVLTSNGTVDRLARGVSLASIAGGVPTAAAAALVIPPSILTAFQNKNNAKLIASTQVHAFNNEESTARIGQRVPVQTAQAYPFGVQTGTPNPSLGNNFPTGGFPVINYEPTGLTLKFTPLVYPNFDVQVKMSIESKDVAGAQTITPTFTERTITGTARVQNNRTMLLASVSQDIQSTGRQGLPVLGGLPLVGRLFSSPTRENRQVDIVIAVTPRVLRAPAVTPRDLIDRPSGTLSNPTLGTIATVIAEADREDQIAAARKVARNVTVQVPDVNPGVFAAAENVVNTSSAGDTQSSAPKPSQVSAAASASVPPKNESNTLATNNASPVQTTEGVAPDRKTSATEESQPFVPAPKSLINNQAAAGVAAVNTGAVGTTNAMLTSLAKPIDVSVEAAKTSRIAQLKLATTDEALKVGEKRRFAVELKSDVPLGLAVLTLRFDPRAVTVRGVSVGTMFADNKDAAPRINQSVDANGVCLISISAVSSAQPFKGAGVLLFVDVEAIGAGDSGLSFDKDNTHLVATDARDVVLELSPGQTTIKQ